VFSRTPLNRQHPEKHPNGVREKKFSACVLADAAPGQGAGPNAAAAFSRVMPLHRRARQAFNAPRSMTGKCAFFTAGKRYIK
jgi:hypothetical protein